MNRQRTAQHPYPIVERAIELGIAALAFLVYLRTLAPTITWLHDGADSGDLVAAAFTRGIPHPPGYPLYTLLAALFAHLPLGDPARGVNLLSALASTIAVALVYLCMRELFGRRDDWRARSAAAIVALGFAFSPLFWSQATIAEVYALDALLVAALLAALFSTSLNRLVLAALIFGLGLAHHFSIVLLVPSALLLLSGSLERRSMPWAAAALVAPLLLYLYLPLRASADPPINWGDPSTLQGFVWTVTAEPYHSYLMNLTLADVVGRAAFAARLLFQQFGYWGVGIGLWGLAKMLEASDQTRRRQAYALLLGIGLVFGYASIYSSRDSYVYLIPAFMLFALWIGYGLWDIIRRLSMRTAAIVLVGAIVLLPVYNIAANYAGMDVSKDYAAHDYAERAMALATGNSLVFADGDEHLFSLWYYRHVLEPDSRVTVVSPELLQYDWYYGELRREMPELDTGASSYTERLGEIIRLAQREGRRVWTTEARGFFSSESVRPVGELYSLVEPNR